MMPQTKIVTHILKTFPLEQIDIEIFYFRIV